MTNRATGYSVVMLMIALTALVGLCGCATSGAEARGKATWTDEGAPTIKSKIIFNNSALEDDVDIMNLSDSRSGDMMQAQVTLRSKISGTLNLQYKFEWFDLNGVALNPSAGSWKPLLIYGGETKTIQGLAPDPRGREYKLNLRQAD